MPADGTRTIEHDRTWTLSEILSLTIPTAEITLREYLVTLTAQEAMKLNLPDWAEHVSALDADCDAVVQHMMNTDGELCVRVGVTLVLFDAQ